jgi:hypothetical protein
VEEIPVEGGNYILQKNTTHFSNLLHVGSSPVHNIDMVASSDHDLKRLQQRMEARVHEVLRKELQRGNIEITIRRRRQLCQK